jgi:hypothetical protein
MITKDLLHKLFEYKDGDLIWINPTSRKAKPGNIAGNINKKVRSIGIYNKNYGAHRLIFMYHYGYMPKIIDHIDGNPFNNSIENLREVNNTQNAQNSKLSKSNRLGYKNVSFKKDINKFRVRLVINGKETNFGSFEDVELADLVAQEARDKYFGKFARHC